MTNETVYRFGLLIDKIISEGHTKINVKSNNSGIPDAEVVIIVEAWLENVRENLKKPIKDGMTFFKKGI